MLLFLFYLGPFFPSRNLDEVFTYNLVIQLIYGSNVPSKPLSCFKASMVLTRADHLFKHNYIRSLLNIILRTIIMIRTGLEPSSYCLCV